MTYTSSDLKYDVEQAGHEPFFFTRKTMGFFGDTMANYGVSGPFEIIGGLGIRHQVFELYRRKAVKHGLQDSAYFCAETFMRINRAN